MAVAAVQRSPVELTNDSEIDIEEERQAKPKIRSGVKFSLGGDSSPSSSPRRTTDTTDKPTLMAPIKPINLNIFTIEGTSYRISFQTGRHTIAGDIVKEMILMLNIPEEMSDVFSLWMVSKHLQLQLKSYHVPVKLFKKWKEFLTQYTNASKDNCQTDKPILSFRRNAFLPIKEEKRLIAKKNSKLALSLLYYEAMYNVVSGRYPMTSEEILELAGYQCAIDNGEYDKSEHTPEKMKESLQEFFPPYMLPTSGKVKAKILDTFKGSGKGSGLEEDLCTKYESAWKRVSTCVQKRVEERIDVEKSAVAVSLGQEEEAKLWQDIDLQLKLLYLQRCWNKPYYGCVMFKGQVERKTSNIKQFLVYSDRSVVVAINPESVHIFKEAKENSPREIMLYLTYDQLSWDFQPATEEGENFYSSLWLEFDSTLGQQKVSKRLQIFSRQAPMMDAMIGRCVDELNKLDEEVAKIRLQQDPSARDAPIHSITGTQVAPTKNYLEDKLICETFTPSGQPVSKFDPLSFIKKKSDASLTQQADDDNDNGTSL